MSIDLRHWVFCSLGPVDPRSPVTIQEDHVQGQGLCLTRATITLTGTHRPAAGSPISLAYSDGVNWIARVPRRLRVLSSQVDPLEGITTISAGCLLTYHSNRKPPVEELRETEENDTVPEVVRRVAVLPMSSAWVAGRILQTLGLTAASTIPFVIKRVVDTWDMSAGYVEELGRIAHSEGYVAWVNQSEQIEFINKRADPTGPGPLLTAAQILEMSPVNVGDLPGDAVFSKYTTTKLVPPEDLGEDEIARRNWERERVVSGSVQAIHTYTDDAGQTIKEFITYNEYSTSETIYDSRDRVISRREASNGLNGVRISETTFSYGSGATGGGDAEDFADVRSETTIEWGPKGDLLAACGANGPHAATFRQRGTITTGWRVTTYDKNKASGITQTKIRNATQYINTPHGADAISRLREAGETVDQLLPVAGRIVGYGSQTRIRTEREFGLQRRPGQQERNQAASAKVPSVEQVAATTWIVGSPASEAAVELSPPYVSDDRIISTGSPPAYSVVPGDAQGEALAFGQGENRLLLGNRSGQGLQLHPMDLPAKPFDTLYLRVNGCTGAYRVNGSTWTMAADGIRCSTDGLFWAAVDGTAADAWFPLPPGVTTLPAPSTATTNPNPRPPNAMAIPAGFNPLAPDLAALFAALPVGLPPVPRATIAPTRLVPPYNVQLSTRGGVRVGGTVRLQTWLPVTLQTAGGVRIGGIGRAINLVGGTSGAIITPHQVTLTQVGGIAGGAALVLHFDGPGFVDSSTNGYPVTASGNAAISTAQKKVGAGSLAVSGFDGIISATGAQLALSVGNWTVSCWVYLNSGGFDERCILQLGPNYGNPGIYVYPYGAGNSIAWFDGGFFEAVSDTIPEDTWVHVLASKEANTLRLYVNGTTVTESGHSTYEITSATGTANITGTTVHVGGADRYSFLHDGYIDEVVIEPGRVVNADFTPPTGPYPFP